MRGKIAVWGGRSQRVGVAEVTWRGLGGQRAGILARRGLPPACGSWKDCERGIEA